LSSKKTVVVTGITGTLGQALGRADRARGWRVSGVARRVGARGNHETLTGYLPMTGEELHFRLDELESFQVLDG